MLKLIGQLENLKREMLIFSQCNSIRFYYQILLDSIILLLNESKDFNYVDKGKIKR